MQGCDTPATMRPQSVLLSLLVALASTPACANKAALPQPVLTATAPAPTVPAAPADPAPTPAATNGELAAGQLAPDFGSHDQNGTAVQLAGLRGKHVLLYFYPKDEKPGCTQEASSLRDAWSDLGQLGVVVLGVSTDDDASHRAFAQHHQLPFSLLSDPEGKLAEKYGVPVHLGFAMRQSFLIAPDGRLKKIYRSVDVANHAYEIAAAVR